MHEEMISTSTLETLKASLLEETFYQEDHDSKFKPLEYSLNLEIYIYIVLMQALPKCCYIESPQLGSYFTGIPFVVKFCFQITRIVIL